MALGHVPELERHPGRQPAAGMDQHRQAPLVGQCEDRLEQRVVDAERLRTGVQLDAARAAVETAHGLAERILVEAQPHEREQPVGRLGGPLEHAVVGRAVGGLAVGLVERENVCGTHAGLVHEAQMVCHGEGVAVLVEPEMRVRVERGAAFREERRDALALRRQQLLSALDEGGLGHPPEPIRSPHGRSHATWGRFAPVRADPLAELRRGGRPPARAVRRRHRVRHPGRAHARDLPRPRGLRDPPRLAASRAGRGVHGRRLRARRGQAGRLHAHHGRGPDECRHADRERLPRLDPDARRVERDCLRGQRPRARQPARPARPAGVHGHDHGRVDRGARPRRAARGVRPGLRDLRVAAAAPGAHRHSRSTSSTCPDPPGSASRRAERSRSPTPRSSSAPSSCWPRPSARCCCSEAAPSPPAPRPPRSPSASGRPSA